MSRRKEIISFIISLVFAIGITIIIRLVNEDFFPVHLLSNDNTFHFVINMITEIGFYFGLYCIIYYVFDRIILRK